MLLVGERCNVAVTRVVVDGNKNSVGPGWLPGERVDKNINHGAEKKVKKPCEDGQRRISSSMNLCLEK